MTKPQLLTLLQEGLSGRTQTAYAASLGISGAYLSDILKGRREPGPKLLTALGLEMVYRKMEKEG